MPPELVFMLKSILNVRGPTASWFCIITDEEEKVAICRLLWINKEGCSIFYGSNVLKAKAGFLWFKCARERLIRSLQKERATLLLVYNVVVREKSGYSVFVWIFNAFISSDMFILEKKCMPCNGFTIHDEDRII